MNREGGGLGRQRDAEIGGDNDRPSLEKWRKLPTGLTSHFRLFHVAYDSLPTVIDVDFKVLKKGRLSGKVLGEPRPS